MAVNPNSSNNKLVVQKMMALIGWHRIIKSTNDTWFFIVIQRYPISTNYCYTATRVDDYAATTIAATAATATATGWIAPHCRRVAGVIMWTSDRDRGDWDSAVSLSA